ncbi:unnamed protein product, partial [Phaeothamnion confervicola]
QAWLGRAKVFSALKRYDEAFAAYDTAAALDPTLADVWLGRGNLCWTLNRFDEALAAYLEALTLRSDLAEAFVGRGNVFSALGRHDEAFAAYDRAFVLKPNIVGLEGSRLHAKMFICDWIHHAEERAHLIASSKSGMPNA